MEICGLRVLQEEETANAKVRCRVGYSRRATGRATQPVLLWQRERKRVVELDVREVNRGQVM